MFRTELYFDLVANRCGIDQWMTNAVVLRVDVFKKIDSVLRLHAGHKPTRSF